MKLNRDELNSLPLDDAKHVALLIADATQNVRSPEARAAGSMMFLQVFLAEVGIAQQDLATVTANMLAEARRRAAGTAGDIRALAQYVAGEMLENASKADTIFGDDPEFQ